MKIMKAIFIGTILSILVFFSISFLTVLAYLNPLHIHKASKAPDFEIGFPFKYYEQFWLSGSKHPNSGWTLNNLLYDCFITWLVITGLYLIWFMRKNNKR